ncbi:sugar phosphate isomerase/epimerase family protein [Mycolicibacterium sp. GCM10028919]|uniref:sugar phosphate isomerase/epimerase family protein n=1 Tax=Mycolicibacterium sp. GCM10028919 TaxID=3273401 RepID=UPI0036223601
MADFGRLSVHGVGLLGAAPAEYDAYWQTLGLGRVSLVDDQLRDAALAPLIARRGYVVDTVFHLFRTPEALDAAVDAAAAIGARCVYMLTGGRDGLTWEQAAERFCDAVAPCRDHAENVGVALAIENASALYADIHFAHSLRDTATLAEMADLDVVVDLFHCWAEADLTALVERVLPRTQSIQLSDYVLGDRSLPARAVPGDGAIPIERFVRHAIENGYRHGFDLELIGPRIDREGPLDAARRACVTVAAMLDRIG